MEQTPIYDQLMTQQRQAETEDPAPRETAAANKAEGLPWLRFFRG